MKRVLHFQGRMGKGGAESFMMNLYRRIDRRKVQFDFLIYDDFAHVTDYHEEIKKLGGRIFVVTNPKKNIIKYWFEVRKLLAEQHFDIVHNEVYFGGGINLLLARKRGITQRIAHSHATSDGKSSNFLMNLLRKYLHHLLIKEATDFLAVSKEAGDSLFQGHPYEIIHNGIDLSLYKTDEDVRAEKRAELGLSPNDFVIGNIGRLEKQKNQTYLIDIVSELLQKKPDAKLLIVGAGSLQKSLEKQITELSLSKNVYLLGERNDIPELFQAMDVFCMTSLYEGLPMVGLEAQASRKKLVLSSTISPDTKLTPNVTFIGLDEAKATWCEAILSQPLNNELTQELMEYDVSHTLQQMLKVYKVY
ncbi:glycosyltransferase family 1 protein [Enterococcus mundtii]|uniref:glycosyltransferase family 1 protein n=1 Tax=Enterococcus mundtii TaxID=53346 RepID=UPI00321AE5B4